MISTAALKTNVKPKSNTTLTGEMAKKKKKKKIEKAIYHTVWYFLILLPKIATLFF